MPTVSRPSDEAYFPPLYTRVSDCVSMHCRFCDDLQLREIHQDLAAREEEYGAYTSNRAHTLHSYCLMTTRWYRNISYSLNMYSVKLAEETVPCM